MRYTFPIYSVNKRSFDEIYDDNDDIDLTKKTSYPYFSSKKFRIFFRWNFRICAFFFKNIRILLSKKNKLKRIWVISSVIKWIERDRNDHRLRTKEDFGKDMEEKLWGERNRMCSVSKDRFQCWMQRCAWDAHRRVRIAACIHRGAAVITRDDE